MSIADPDAVLQAAHAYARRGWRVIPLHIPVVNDSGIICSCMRPGCNSVGKHPVEPRWQAAEPMSGADIQATFEDGMRNVGIATGAPSGFWVLDVDLDKPGTEERFHALIAEYDEIPQTYCIRTGGGGYQLYWAMPDFNVTNSAKRLPDGIDVRGTGGQVVAPPSVSGKGPYTVVRDLPIVRAPQWLEDLVRPLPPTAPVDLETVPKLIDLPESEQRRLRQYTETVIGRENERLRECREKGWNGPGWNDTTFQVACTLVELANSPWCPLTLEEARWALLAKAPRDRGFGDAEIEACFSSALKTVAGKGRAMPENRDRPSITVIPGDPLTDPTAVGAAGGSHTSTPTDGSTAAEGVQKRDWSDLGNARRLVDVFGHRLRYIPERKDWAVYTEGIWVVEDGAGLTAAQDLLENLVEREGHLYDDTPGDDEPSERERFFKWAKAQQMSARIDACVKQATGRRELRAKETDFDTEPHLINCANGVIDLRTGELLDHSPEFLHRLRAPVKYHPEAQAPRWMAFLERCLPDPEIRDYLQVVTGYSMTGSMAEQAMFLHHGSGANGKSVFLVVASELLGDYAQTVPRETLLQKGTNTEHPTSVARMSGRRFLQATETAAGRRLDEETVKGLTGGEKQTARFMGANFFDFTPTGKIHLVTNHLPRLTDAESIWRRMHLIGWNQTIPEKERDPQLAEKIIREESEGVFAWAVAGAVRWYALNQAGRLIERPASMKRDLDEYREDQDTLGEFLDLRIQADEHAFSPMSTIYNAYTAWTFASGIRNVMTQQDLAKVLKERRFEPHRTKRARGFKVKVLELDRYAPQESESESIVTV